MKWWIFIHNFGTCLHLQPAAIALSSILFVSYSKYTCATTIWPINLLRFLALFLQFFLLFCVLHIDGLMQEIRNSIATALELRLPCLNPSIWCCKLLFVHRCCLYGVCILCNSLVNTAVATVSMIWLIYNRVESICQQLTITIYI